MQTFQLKDMALNVAAGPVSSSVVVVSQAAAIQPQNQPVEHVIDAESAPE